MKLKALVIGLFLILGSLVVFSNWQKNMAQTQFLSPELNELESYIKFRDSLDPKVSKVPISWHLDHTLRTINEIYKAVKRSDPDNYKASFNPGRSLVLITNRIPRGRAESPKIVRPPDLIITDSLYIQLRQSRKNLSAYDSLPADSYFSHPYLGDLRKRTARKFLKIHTEHHLKIIRDILKQ
ncbi:hypothetical protein [Poritiphilus flavus]|uniref:DUF1569 domain-containing protein n=1 Tax=Poritiphilus flavus TaxID=2697053 RepID=A0A6L9EDB4_9FLAO|nr:hypothetical protein [Poritiphilus flavus]NAS12633.1 hypothetical protein [Poritiphilus flavus]